MTGYAFTNLIRKAAIAEAWLERTVAAYPEPARRFLLEEKDRFRNPVGHTLREGLAALLDEALGEMDRARITAVLDDVMHVRAVQDFTPTEAVAFLPALKPILREHKLGTLDTRIDELALIASDLYQQCRRQIEEIRARWHPLQPVAPQLR
ncbi:MAG: RsbRD N-terminal domain-containing protein [Acidobacteriota bacterium]